VRCNQYGILFTISPFCEYINFKHARVHATYRVHQSECVISIIVTSPHGYVDTYATLCPAGGSTHTESGTLYHKVKHRARPKVCSRRRPKRTPTKRRSTRRLRRRAPHTEHSLGVLSKLTWHTKPTPSSSHPVLFTGTRRQARYHRMGHPVYYRREYRSGNAGRRVL